MTVEISLEELSTSLKVNFCLLSFRNFSFETLFEDPEQLPGGKEENEEKDTESPQPVEKAGTKRKRKKAPQKQKRKRKRLSYEDFEITDEDRKQRSFPSHPQQIDWNVVEANYNFQCPICLRLLDRPHVVMDCLHRFCEACINKALRTGKKECPVTLSKLFSPLFCAF